MGKRDDKGAVVSDANDLFKTLYVPSKLEKFYMTKAYRLGCQDALCWFRNERQLSEYCSKNPLLSSEDFLERYEKEREEIMLLHQWIPKGIHCFAPLHKVKVLEAEEI